MNTSMYMIFYCSGVVTTAFLGSVIVNWRLVVSLGALVSSLAFVGTLFIHDSPEWLLQKGHTKEAKKAWDYYNPNSPLKEYENLVNEVNEEKPLKDEKSG